MTASKPMHREPKDAKISLPKADYLMRNAILALLSDQETGTLSTAEAAPRIASGTQYLDLERLEEGIQRAGPSPVPTGRVLSRAAVRDSTWSAILATLAGFPPIAGDAPLAGSPPNDEITQPPFAPPAH